jgi:hypothetical protein
MGAPFTMWIAPPGTTKPALTVENDDLNVAWVLLGQTGNKSYSEEGVRINSPAAYNAFRGLGSAAPRKMFRSEEDVMAQVTLADLTLEQLANAFNKLAADISGTDTRKLELSRGLTVATAALLVRGPSPYKDDGYSQWYIPAACNTSSPEIVMRRDNATTYALEWRAIWYDEAAEGEELGVYEADADVT